MGPVRYPSRWTPQEDILNGGSAAHPWEVSTGVSVVRHSLSRLQQSQAASCVEDYRLHILTRQRYPQNRNLLRTSENIPGIYESFRFTPFVADCLSIIE